MLEAAQLRRTILRAVADVAPNGLVVRHGPRTSNGVALTFDDGPDDHTEELLALLDRLEVRATFFLLGAACERWPARVRDIVSRGHEVAPHGFTHTTFPKLSAEALEDELRRCAAFVPPQARKRPLVRPPRGAVTPTSLLRCARAGWTTVLWSLDSDDCRTDDPDVVAARLEEARGGDIVLLHEGEASSRGALARAVASIRARGLELVTVSELIG